MTLEQFLKKLEHTPRKWQLLSSGCIRYEVKDAAQTWFNGNHCPISYVGESNPCRVAAPANRLGLSQVLAYDIARAADEQFPPHEEYYYSLRKQLLRACGLEKS